MHLNNGDLAPNFEALSDEGRPIQLADYHGKRVVLFFYPKAGTSGCTTQVTRWPRAASPPARFARQTSPPYVSRRVLSWTMCMGLRRPGRAGKDPLFSAAGWLS